MRSFNSLLFALTAIICLLSPAPSIAAAFRVASYNLENYVAGASPSRPPKSPASKQAVLHAITALQADVLAIQEIGDTNALADLRQSLRTSGVDYPFWEHVAGFDTNIFVAVLSKHPIIARRSHSKDGFLLHGRRFRISRGFVEVDIRVNPDYTFTLFSAHLKSKRAIASADESELREQEAILLREKIDSRLKANPRANIIVLGDFNDHKNSPAVKTLLGKGPNALIDTRPAELEAAPAPSPRNITWTHYYQTEDAYSRIDYILLSRAMAREWNQKETFVWTSPTWGLASDHRPVVASFWAEDR